MWFTHNRIEELLNKSSIIIIIITKGAILCIEFSAIVLSL